MYLQMERKGSYVESSARFYIIYWYVIFLTVLGLHQVSFKCFAGVEINNYKTLSLPPIICFEF
jgi:hypothetical protein